mmetsp:Transcript_155592/g.290362  ORF Transcript_155592/g.290362 Transcript_155592/m.290362 type:complete len:229 (-) Transcript_155592:1146-1832(-)
MLNNQRPDHLCRWWWAVRQMTSLHCTKIVILAPEVLKVARLDLLQDALLHQIWDAILPVRDHADGRTPLLTSLGLLRLFWLLRLLGLLLLCLVEHRLQIGQLLLHGLVNYSPQLGLYNWEDRLASQLHIMPLVEIVALIAVLPHLCILIDLFDELLHNLSWSDIIHFFLNLFFATFAILGLLVLVTLILLRIFASFLCVFCLVSLVCLLLLVKTTVELIKLCGERRQF